jgi:hypothetical protein
MCFNTFSRKTWRKNVKGICADGSIIVKHVSNKWDMRECGPDSKDLVGSIGSNNPALSKNDNEHPRSIKGGKFCHQLSEYHCLTVPWSYLHFRQHFHQAIVFLTVFNRIWRVPACYMVQRCTFFAKILLIQRHHKHSRILGLNSMFLYSPNAVCVSYPFGVPRGSSFRSQCQFWYFVSNQVAL